MLYTTQIYATSVFHLVTVAYCILEGVPVGCEDEGVPHFLIPVQLFPGGQLALERGGGLQVKLQRGRIHG